MATRCGYSPRILIVEGDRPYFRIGMLEQEHIDGRNDTHSIGMIDDLTVFIAKRYDLGITTFLGHVFLSPCFGFLLGFSFPFFWFNTGLLFSFLKRDDSLFDFLSEGRIFLSKRFASYQFVPRNAGLLCGFIESPSVFASFRQLIFCRFCLERNPFQADLVDVFLWHSRYVAYDLRPTVADGQGREIRLP